MKRYWKEIVAVVIQSGMFYILPLFAGPTDAMGMVILMLLSAVILGLVLGVISGEKVKFLYPVALAVLFLPSVPIYYNESALIHAVWYLVVSAVGLALGSLFRLCANVLLSKK